MEFEGKDLRFSQPVKIHGNNENGLVHSREELHNVVGEFFWGLTESRQWHLAQKLSEVIECMLEGHRPRNMVDVIGDAGNRQITHLYKGRISRREPFGIAFHWNPGQIPPLEIISVRWTPSIARNYGGYNDLRGRIRRRAGSLYPGVTSILKS